MSIASECNRLIGLRDRIRTKLINLGLMRASQQAGANDLEDCTEAIEDIGGTVQITSLRGYDVAGYQYAEVYEPHLLQGNIVRGVTILGVTGTADVNPPSANLEQGAYYYGGAGAPPSIIYPSSGHDGFSTFSLELTDANPKLVSSNIKNGVTIMGVTGSYETPTESKTMALGSAAPSTVTPSNNRHLSQVAPSIDTSVVKASNIKRGVSILGVQGNYKGTMIPLQTYYGGESAPFATINPPSGYDGYSSVNTSLVSEGRTLVAGNIKRGVTIMGVQGDLDFSSWPTAHSGYFNDAALQASPSFILHSTNPEALSFPLATGTGTSLTFLTQGALSLSDVEYMIVDCNGWEVSLDSSTAYIIGVEYQRDVYGSLGNVLTFKVLYNGKYYRLYSGNASISLELRSFEYRGTTYSNKLCMKVTASPFSGNIKWQKINCHNETGSGNFGRDIYFYNDLLYHIDVKYTN